MAIKGKKRPRPRGQALPPRPTISARKPPLAARRDVKRAAVITLAVLAMLGGLRIWQNVSRADAVRDYNAELISAQEPLLGHLRQDSLTNVQTSLDQFQQGKMPGKQFLDLSAIWETDFKKAKENVDALKPPNDVAKEAQQLIVEGLDGYIGVARMYNLAAQLKQNGEAEKDAAKKKLWDDKVQVLLQHALEFRQRADRVYTIGQGKFDDLKVRYKVEAPLPPQGGTAP
ncbi:MAG: hypothetical protein ACRDKG_08680 [Actinomycetota bacterium]